MLPTLVEVKNGAVTELVMISSLMASTELICGQVGTTQCYGVPVYSAVYSALCFQSNFRAAHTLCSYVDQKQLLYAIQSEYLSGPLRAGFSDLLIALHIESHATSKTMEVTTNEYIIPLSPELKELYSDPSLTHSLYSLHMESIQPQMATTEIQEHIETIKTLATPYFPLETVKSFAIDALDQAVKLNQVHNRDPIGGSNEMLFIPLLRMIDKLLLVGILKDDDVMRLLVLIDPETWDSTFDRQGKDEHRKGLLQMSLAEGAKLEMCCLLHHLSDIQLRHRVESIVAFSHDFIGEIQTDQLRRYIVIKQSDLPSAVAAKKTKEFRCPPREQMNAILGFKNLPEEERDNCPCNEEMKKALLEFHEEFVSKLSVSAGGGEEAVPPEDVKDEAKPGLVSKMINVITMVKKNSEEAPKEESAAVKTPEEIFRKGLVTTIVRWAEESVIGRVLVNFSSIPHVFHSAGH